MAYSEEPAFDLRVLRAEDDGFRQYLQGILNQYHWMAHPLLDMPKTAR
jgi:hypothetical protein